MIVGADRNDYAEVEESDQYYDGAIEPYMFEPIASDSSNSTYEGQSQDEESFIIQTGLYVNGIIIDGCKTSLDVKN